jgi:hypothetical protein
VVAEPRKDQPYPANPPGEFNTIGTNDEGDAGSRGSVLSPRSPPVSFSRPLGSGQPGRSVRWGHGHCGTSKYAVSRGVASHERWQRWREPCSSTVRAECAPVTGLLLRFNRTGHLQTEPLQGHGVAERLGIPPSRLLESARWLNSSGTVYASVEAANAALSSPIGTPIAIGALRIPGIRFIADAVYQWVATHVIVFPERRRTVSHTPALADGTCEGQLTNPRYFLRSCREIGSSRSGWYTYAKLLHLETRLARHCWLWTRQHCVHLSASCRPPLGWRSWWC